MSSSGPTPRDKSPRDNPRLVYGAYLFAVLLLGGGYLGHYFLSPIQTSVTSPDGRYTVTMVGPSPYSHLRKFPHYSNPITLRDNTTHKIIPVQDVPPTAPMVIVKMFAPLDDPGGIWWNHDSRGFVFLTHPNGSNISQFHGFFEIQEAPLRVRVPIIFRCSWLRTLFLEKSHVGNDEQRACAQDALKTIAVVEAYFNQLQQRPLQLKQAQLRLHKARQAFQIARQKTLRRAAAKPATK